MIVAKSAIEAAATTSWPNGDSIRPESLSTGTTTPSEVAESTIAMNRALLTWSVACRMPPATSAIANETKKPVSADPATRPRSLSYSISRPARKSRKARPRMPSTRTGSSISTQPSTAGPITMPARISSTTAGKRSAGASPSSSGAQKATAATISRFVNSSSMTPRQPRPRSAAPICDDRGRCRNRIPICTR